MKIKLCFSFGTSLTLCDVEFVRVERNIVSVYFWEGVQIPRWIATHEPTESVYMEQNYKVADFESVERIERVF